ncbi:MAG TPA: carboxypeptidase-like regulatory domain-containing protein [Candidatus Thermoplasmatota archaeon]|nr:carboxypeptidase-like regulatory domain-containing protein [Candidatus Thermoplasmatota archaeon]
MTVRAARATLALAAALLAGCSGSATDPGSGAATTTPHHPDSMDIHGLVEDSALRPIAGATLGLLALNITATSDASGAFRFDDVPYGIQLVQATAPGYLPGSARVDPTTANETLLVILEAAPDTTPRNVTQQYRGILQCAAELLIVTGSCDAVLTFAGVDPVLDQNATWDFEVEANWRTLVLDVVFDPDAQPGLDGLRVVVRALTDSASLGEYGQYGRFNGSSPFTVRLEPGASYPDGDAPVPENATVFRIDVYPQSHGWHSVCDPSGTYDCFLGAGAGIDVAFDLFVTAFYNEDAPEGWTLQAA